MADPSSASPAASRVVARVQELSPEGPRRRFLIVIPAARIAALHEARLAELGLKGAPGPAQPAWTPAVRDRVAASALADACRKASEEALAGLLRRLNLPILGQPQLDTLAGPPDGDLILRAELWTLPEPTLPDPATLRVERLVAQPDPAEEDRALAALAATRAGVAEQPPGTAAEAGDELVCDVGAWLLPAENRIPQPGLAGAAPGALPGPPGRLPDGWSFGDNGAGLAAEVLAVEAAADPPHLRLRVHGTAATDGQSFVIFHPARAIPARAGLPYVGSVLLRPAGAPTGLRGAKLRLEGQSAAEGALRRKDAALTLRQGATGFARCYVSDRMMEPGTAFLRLPLLFDHAAGAVDFRLDIALPRLVEGLDLGEAAAVPLPEFAGRARRFAIGGAPDAAGLAPHLPGIALGETRAVTLRLPDNLDDRALAGRQARFTIRAVALRRHVVPAVDDALARALGHADLPALRRFVAGAVAAHHARLSDRAAQRALVDALLAAAGDVALPAPALHAEIAALRARLPAATPQAIAALAARRLRGGLVLGAVARLHGLAGPEQAIAFLLARAQVTERAVPAAELAAAATA